MVLRYLVAAGARCKQGFLVLSPTQMQWDTVQHCWELPPTTFGGAYAKFMGDRRFLAGDRPPVRCVASQGSLGLLACRHCCCYCCCYCPFANALVTTPVAQHLAQLAAMPSPHSFVDDPELAYVITRIREARDPGRRRRREWRGSGRGSGSSRGVAVKGAG